MAKFGVKEVADVTFYNLATGKPELFLDTLKMSNLENDAERSYVQGGRGNSRIMAFDYNRTAQFVIQDALMNPKALSMQAGTELKEGVEEVHNREVLTAVDNAGVVEVTLSESPNASVLLYATADGVEQGEEITGFTNTDGVIDVTSATPAPADGDKVIAYYTYETQDNAQTMTIKSDQFSGDYKIVGDTVVRNASTKQDEAFQVVIPKAKIASNFSLNMSPEGEPAVFDMNIDVFKDDNSSDMVKMVRY